MRSGSVAQLDTELLGFDLAPPAADYLAKLVRSKVRHRA